LIKARVSGTNRFPGIPNILDVVLRDATLYFLLIFAFQLILFFFLLFAPVGDPYYVRGLLILLYSSVVRVQPQVGLQPGLYVFSPLEVEATFE